MSGVNKTQAAKEALAFMEILAELYPGFVDGDRDVNGAHFVEWASWVLRQKGYKNLFVLLKRRTEK